MYIFLESAECTPGDVFKYVGEHAIFASGSPFSDVLLGMISPNLVV
jgi:Malic enzyme, NAD binding domain